MMRQPEDRVLYIAHAESRLGASGIARLHAHRFDWRFAHPPEAVWPALADTGRFNEAAGLPKHAVREVAQPDGSVRFFAEARIGPRSEERSVGKECVSTCRLRGSPDH